MKSIIFSFLAFMLFSNPQKPTVDTYDWSNYHKKSKLLDDAITDIVKANVLLFDSKQVNYVSLPQKTKIQLAILHDAEYEEWKTAENELGKDEAAKYWQKMKAKEPVGLSCFDPYNNQHLELKPLIYKNIDNCRLKTRTACHIQELEKALDLVISFHLCMDDKYTDRSNSNFQKDPIFTTY